MMTNYWAQECGVREQSWTCKVCGTDLGSWQFEHFGCLYCYNSAYSNFGPYCKSCANSHFKECPERKKAPKKPRTVLEVYEAVDSELRNFNARQKHWSFIKEAHMIQVSRLQTEMTKAQNLKESK